MEDQCAVPESPPGFDTGKQAEKHRQRQAGRERERERERRREKVRGRGKETLREKEKGTERRCARVRNHDVAGEIIMKLISQLSDKGKRGSATEGMIEGREKEKERE